MTNKDAIEILRKIALYVPAGVIDPRDFYLALDLAINVLEEHPTDKEIQDDMRKTYLGGKE